MTRLDSDKRAELQRQIAEIEARKPLNRAQLVAILIRQAGGFIPCGCGCGEPLDPLGEAIIDEHRVALGYHPDDPNGLPNREIWRKPCSAAKTKGDQTGIAKAKRLSGETCAGPTKRPINSRPFDTRFTKKMRTGEVVERKRRTAK